jgi:tRNA(fMet)-specific endonuclease VapC
MVCLDTSFLVDLMRTDNDKALRKLIEFRNERLCTTTITLAELYRGAYNSSNTTFEVSKVDKLLQNFEILTLDNESAKKYGEFHNLLRSNPIGDADLFIASIVISKNETLLTRNLKHFERIQDLKVSSW